MTGKGSNKPKPADQLYLKHVLVKDEDQQWNMFRKTKPNIDTAHITIVVEPLKNSYETLRTQNKNKNLMTRVTTNSLILSQFFDVEDDIKRLNQKKYSTTLF